jgi:hypothetical protein
LYTDFKTFQKIKKSKTKLNKCPEEISPQKIKQVEPVVKSQKIKKTDS